jgi:hypothetical protein
MVHGHEDVYHVQIYRYHVHEVIVHEYCTKSKEIIIMSEDTIPGVARLLHGDPYYGQ